MRDRSLAAVALGFSATLALLGGAMALGGGTPASGSSSPTAPDGNGAGIAGDSGEEIAAGTDRPLG
ncbi:hypothetical protein [Streptomyces sp. NBC_01803]|uniref:hypothetical protein n=1 Tax=Streptomyces sp. NBC_01803 TaxID=2975946 RepID=UPI002DD9686D|nr:hypothetical protein [Streptomyces sp. NBC_01803]WSA43463.1 hypothetical protein OIE51_04180 [Streptomyces sp. NBC_01803]